MSMRKQIHCTLMLWDATHDKLYVFPWFPGLLFYLPMRSYLSRACFFQCSLTIPWEVIFPWFPGLVFYVHWPSHDKLSFCGFQGPFDAWTWENILLSPWYPDHHHHWWIRKKNLQFLSQLTRVRGNWSPRSCPSAGRTSCGTSHSTEDKGWW